MTLTYPPTRTVDQTDNYHGTVVADPYRWLEDGDSPETAAWVEAQNAVTFGYLRALPQREAIRARLTQLWDYERFSLPYKKGSRYFYSRNNGLQNQSVLFVSETLGGEGRLLLDPNTLSPDGTIALSGTAVSEDGKYMAYSVSVAGSDWQEWRVRDIATLADLPDVIQWSKFSGASWTHDSKGFFYSRFDAPGDGGAAQFQGSNYFQKLYYHRLGETQETDTLIYERPDQREWNIGAYVTDDGNYLVINVSQGTERKNRLFLKEIAPAAPGGDYDLTRPVADMLPHGDAAYAVVENDGSLFYIKTDRDAPRARVFALDVAAPGDLTGRAIIPETADTLQSVSLFGGEFIAVYLHDAHTRVVVYGLDGAWKRDLALPGIGSAGGWGGRRDDTETFYYFTSYATPPRLYRYEVATGVSTLYKEPTVPFRPDDFETRQVFAASKDGTPVPLFITHKKGITPEGSRPTYLYGYGGFTISLTPNFSAGQLAWMEMGGVVVVANLRGGGEYGKEWHEAGTKLRKQNVFDDFIAAAEWLIENKYTNPARLVIAGGSNGGLLVGACLNQRPDLFGAALPAVGVMDMLRFDQFTIGWGWKSDYGDPADPVHFAALYAYSPLHNIKPGTVYPATLITTSDHDDRVVPAHSFKYAAALQAAQAPDGPPVLIRIEVRAGHGAGKPVAKIIEESADMLAFAAENIGLSVSAGFGG